MEYLFIAIRSVLVIEYIYVILLFIGWLLATDYYDTISNFVDEFCFVISNLIICIIMCLDIIVQCAIFFNADPATMNPPIQMVPIVIGGFINAFILLCAIIIGSLEIIFKIREYCENKRGK